MRNVMLVVHKSIRVFITSRFLVSTKIHFHFTLVVFLVQVFWVVVFKKLRVFICLINLILRLRFNKMTGDLLRVKLDVRIYNIAAGPRDTVDDVKQWLMHEINSRFSRRTVVDKLKAGEVKDQSGRLVFFCRLRRIDLHDELVG